MINDIIITSKIKEGDIKAFETLFKRFYSPLCLYGTSITGQYEVAEEIVEEIFYKIWKDRDKIKITFSIKSYLYSAVKYQSFHYLNHCKTMEDYNKFKISDNKTAYEDPSEKMELKELNEFINKILAELPPRRLKIFNMHRNEGKKYSDIAAALSVSIKTIEAEMTRTLKFLRNRIEAYTRES